MSHTANAVNWDGKKMEVEVVCESSDLRKVAEAAHREIGKLRDGHGRPYTTYMLVRIDGRELPFDVVCR